MVNKEIVRLKIGTIEKYGAESVNGVSGLRDGAIGQVSHRDPQKGILVHALDTAPLQWLIWVSEDDIEPVADWLSI